MNPELKQSLVVLTPALVPTLAVLIAILQNTMGLNSMSRRIDDLRDWMNKRIDSVNDRIDDLRDSMNKRFDDAQGVWRAELHRVEEVIDARLKHLEER